MVSGAGTNMAALLYASRQPGAMYEIVLVASNDPSAGAIALAKAEGTATFALSHKGMDRSGHDAAMNAAIRKSGATHIALAGYMRVLGGDFVREWEGRMLNIHPSLLPRYRGLETHRRAIEAGDSHGGASVHLVTGELDAGEVLGQAEVVIMADDTAGSLAARVKIAEHQLYPRVLNEYAGRPYNAEWLLGRVRALALAMPEAEERESHGAPGWRSGGKSGKYFAHFSDRHHGENTIALLVKTDGPDELAALVERDPETYYKPAYYGAAGWAGIRLDRADCDWRHVQEWLERSWQSVAPRRLANLRNAADAF